MTNMKLRTVKALISNDQFSCLQASTLSDLLRLSPVSIRALAVTSPDRGISPLTTDREAGHDLRNLD